MDFSVPAAPILLAAGDEDDVSALSESIHVEKPKKMKARKMDPVLMEAQSNYDLVPGVRKRTSMVLYNPGETSKSREVVVNMTDLKVSGSGRSKKKKSTTVTITKNKTVTHKTISNHGNNGSRPATAKDPPQMNTNAEKTNAQTVTTAIFPHVAQRSREENKLDKLAELEIAERERVLQKAKNEDQMALAAGYMAMFSENFVKVTAASRS